MAEQQITPVTELESEQTQPRLTIQPTFKAGDGSEWAFNGQGYAQIVKPWEVESHIPPTQLTEKLGDVPAWCEYVTRYGAGRQAALLLTWNESGLKAVLDYPESADAPARRKWLAEHPFVRSSQWSAWLALANGTMLSQQQAVEKLDALAQDIVEPDSATVIGILRKLRATVNASASSEMDQDGSTKIEFKRNTKMEGSVSIPSEITVGIPMLKGHTTEVNGKLSPVIYRGPVKVRPTIDDSNGVIYFRFLMTTAEQVLESAIADRVAEAKALLGAEYQLLRAAS